MKRFLVYMSDCLDETSDYVENQVFLRNTFEFKFIPNLENMKVNIKHFPNFQHFVKTLHVDAKTLNSILPNR